MAKTKSSEQQIFENVAQSLRDAIDQLIQAGPIHMMNENHRVMVGHPYITFNGSSGGGSSTVGGGKKPGVKALLSTGPKKRQPKRSSEQMAKDAAEIMKWIASHPDGVTGAQLQAEYSDKMTGPPKVWLSKHAPEGAGKLKTKGKLRSMTYHVEKD